MFDAFAICIPVALLAGFLLFVRRDRKRMERSTPQPLAIDVPKAGWPSSGPQYWKACAGFSAMFSFLALASLVNPPAPPFTGRLGTVHLFLHETVGQNGSAYGWSALAILFLLVGIGLRRRRGQDAA